MSDEDALALSYLTPALSKRIQKQLLAQLAPSEARKLHRTMSSCTSEEQNGSLSGRSTLPRRFSVETNSSLKEEPRTQRSFLPIKKEEYRPSSEFSIRSSSIGAEPRCDNKFLRTPKVSKSISLREPKIYSSKSDLQSPDSSISESISTSYKNDSSKCISESSISRPYSKYSSESLYSRYSPNKSTEAIDSSKTDLQKPKKVSRFLRPDFFEGQKEENIYLRDKKEREMETQKVLKEIRDKRKGRLYSRRETSLSREVSEKSEEQSSKETDKPIKESETLLPKVSASIKTLENSTNSIHDYVNVPGTSGSSEQNTELIHDYVNVKATNDATKKDKQSRIARPKSYPAETVIKENPKEKNSTTPEKESKLSKIRKGFSKNKDKSKEDKKSNAEEDKNQKNKLLQTLEKKLEKFRASKDSQAVQDKKSTVENVIKRLREQSLPRNLEHCTESGLIKRAVSVEDLSGNKTLQASRKSVTKILGLFKKYEDQEKKKVIKKPKNKIAKKDSENNNDQNSIINDSSVTDSSQVDKKERPRSLLIDKIKQYQNGTNEKEPKTKSKLPVNSYRRSLNLDNMSDVVNNNAATGKPDRRHLKLDLSKIQSKSEPVVIREPIPSSSTQEDSNFNENRNSLAMTDDSSTVLSPSDDYQSCDSWSVMSEYPNVNDLHSPLSPNGYLYSGDENESVIDRIRRKSFYTRFNEKKRIRKPNSYNMDLGYKSPTDYSSLDRSNYGYRSSISRR